MEASWRSGSGGASAGASPAPADAGSSVCAAAASASAAFSFAIAFTELHFTSHTALLRTQSCSALLNEYRTAKYSTRTLPDQYEKHALAMRYDAMRCESMKRDKTRRGAVERIGSAMSECNGESLVNDDRCQLKRAPQTSSQCRSAKMQLNPIRMEMIYVYQICM